MSKPNPGSYGAVRLGCKCPIISNRYGAGAYSLPPGNFIYSEDCPLHVPVAKPQHVTEAVEQAKALLSELEGGAA